jgi:hypothetical protein
MRHRDEMGETVKDKVLSGVLGDFISGVDGKKVRRNDKQVVAQRGVNTILI